MCTLFQLGTEQRLEVEASLEIDDSRSERARCLPKVRTRDVARDAGVKVRYVEDVEHIGLDFDRRIVAQDSHVGQSETFGDGDIGIPVTGAGEGVFTDSRRGDEVSCRLPRTVCDGVGIVWNFEVAVREFIVGDRSAARTGNRSASDHSAWIGEVASGFKGSVAGVLAASAKIDGPQTLVPIVAAIAVDLVWRCIGRRPPISCVEGKDAAERPSTCDLLSPTMGVVKDNRLPHAKGLEGSVDVKVRPAVGVSGVVQIGTPLIRTGVCILAVAPCKLSFGREGMGELMLEAGEHHVVTRLSLAAKGVDAVD